MRYGHVMLLGALGLVAQGCSAHSSGPGATSPQAQSSSPVAVAATDGAKANAGTWIGTGAASDTLLVGDAETTLGVWVDAPEAPPAREHVPVDLALVIDTSGSMEGAKIDNARSAAKTLVDALKDGDIVSIDRFDDDAKPVVAPTVINKESRVTVERKIDALATGGSTNLFDGLALGEAHVARAPETHSVRRVVVISDGQANIGPSSPAELGQLAERGVKFHAQVTALGVGNDYSEQTLNALAVRSSGRLYHIDDPKEMAGMLRHELDLLQSTVASDAFVEVVPAPGVQLIGADGIRGDMTTDGSMRIPLGALFSGQHREALVRLRVSSAAKDSDGAIQKPIASVRLHFRDPNEGDLERIQETVARVSWTSDPSVVASHANAKTQSIMAIQEAAQLEMQAAQSVNRGSFDDADGSLAVAEKKLETQASVTKDKATRDELVGQAHHIAAARKATSAAAAAPAPAQRSQALKLNQGGMSGMGF